VLGPYLHAKGRKAVAKRLRKLGVELLQGTETMVAAVGRNAVELADGTTLPSAATIWTVGFSVPDLAARSGLTTDEAGRLLTDETLTSVDSERIVAAGDSAAPSNMAFRMSCQAAGQLGMAAADTVVARIAGEQPVPLRVAFVGQCISLGRRVAVFQAASRHDKAHGLYVGGRMGAKLKEVVCKSTVKQLIDEAKKPGVFRYPGWLRDDERTQLLKDQVMEKTSR